MKSRSHEFVDAPTNTAPLGNEAGARFFAKAGRTQITMDAVAKLKEQPSILRFRESRGSPMPTPRQPTAAQKDDKGRLTHGQLVEVRSAQEIAATLDADGKLDGVPFMPEMAIHCGRAFRVFRRADITCVEGHGLRRMNSTVFLEDVRCDGSAHDGCQRSCLIFWKEAWLKPVEIADAPSIVGEQSEPADTSALINLPTRDQSRYLCQSTVLAKATAD